MRFATASAFLRLDNENVVAVSIAPNQSGAVTISRIRTTTIPATTLVRVSTTIPQIPGPMTHTLSGRGGRHSTIWSPAPMPSYVTLAAAVLDHRDAVLTLADLADLRAGRVMFESPRRGTDPRDRLTYADSVGDTVGDPERLKLRAAYVGAITAFEAASASLRGAEATLRAALQPYGESEDEYPARPDDPDSISVAAA